MLLDAGAKPDIKTRDGASPLWMAASGGHADAVRLLLERGAKAGFTAGDGTPAIWIAAAEGHAEVVKMLAAAGADPNAADRKIEASPVWIAARNGHLECVRELISAGASLDGETRGFTVKGIAGEQGHTEIVELLTIDD